MKAKTAAESLVTTMSAGLALILLNALTCKTHAKADLTEQGVYTLSESSGRLVRNLSERMIVKAYFGNIPPEHLDKQHYVENLLIEYAESSGGKLSWEKIKPPEKPEEQNALKQEGIQQIPIPVLKDDKFELPVVYFSLQFVYLDKKEVWSPDQNFFRRSLEGLEYEFSSLVRRMTAPKKKVGITHGFDEPQETRLIENDQVGLTDLYEIGKVDWATKPEEIKNYDVIIVNGPTRKVSDQAKYYLDQHVMSGKPALFLLPGLKWQSSGGNQPTIPGMPQEDKPYLGMPVAHDLGDLLSAYGFEVASNTIIDGLRGARMIIPIGNPPILTHVFSPAATVQANGKRDVLEGLDVVAMPFTSSVKLVGPLASGQTESFEIKPLMHTSESSF
ncbi:MAG: GldG family protein, partial [Pseudomonadota bacterium]